MALLPICSRHCRNWRLSWRKQRVKRAIGSAPNPSYHCATVAVQPRMAGSMAVNIKKVGIIGAGQMGNGIAHVCALAGFHVKLNDVSPDRIKSALATINGNLTRQVGKKLITEENRKAALDK